MKKEEKPFYGTNVGKGFIDLREYPTAYEMRPTRLYLKEDGDVPSFGILFDASPIQKEVMAQPPHPVLGQLSLNMLNDGLNDVGYEIRKKDGDLSVEINGKNYNIPKAVFDLIHNISIERDNLKKENNLLKQE